MEGVTTVEYLIQLVQIKDRSIAGVTNEMTKESKANEPSKLLRNSTLRK